LSHIGVAVENANPSAPLVGEMSSASERTGSDSLSQVLIEILDGTPPIIAPF
jgi:hypothetical protein